MLIEKFIWPILKLYFQMTKKALVLFISNSFFSASFLFLLMTLVFFANLDKAQTLDAHLRKEGIFKTLEGKEWINVNW